MNLINQTLNSMHGLTLYGSGGGGDPAVAAMMLSRLCSQGKRVELVSFADLPEDGLLITAFGVGPSEHCPDLKLAIQQAVECYSKHLGQNPCGVVPVEIGALSVAIAIEAASALGLPLVDADFVGGRSSPEVYIETITLQNIKRTPAAVCNLNGELALLLESSGHINEERFFRNFSSLGDGHAIVIGYPMLASQAREALELGTVSDALRVGELLAQNSNATALESAKGQVLFSGNVTALSTNTSGGFASYDVQVSRGSTTARVFAKNENLICWINDEVVSTCPDVITFTNSDGIPLYNGQLHEGLQVSVVAVPCRPTWRTSKGLELFSPSHFGFEVSHKLMNSKA
jgi:uncharacterized protein